MIEERFGPIGNERYKDYLKDIHASGQHVMSLANDLLDLAKIEAGKMELQFAPVDANRIIRECVALMQPQAARERIIVRLSLFDKLPNVMADERSLRQIVLNLMSNAVKYNEPGGQVIVSTAIDEAGHAIIRVRDTGVGMNESELGVALEPFKRVGGGRRRRRHRPRPAAHQGARRRQPRRFLDQEPQGSGHAGRGRVPQRAGRAVAVNQPRSPPLRARAAILCRASSSSLRPVTVFAERDAPQGARVQVNDLQIQPPNTHPEVVRPAPSSTILPVYSLPSSGLNAFPAQALSPLGIIL